MTTKIALYGASGRMGQALVRLMALADDLALVGAIDHPKSSYLGRDAGELAGAGNLGVAIDADPMRGLLGADVAIDFSQAGAVDRIVRAAVKARVALVSGTTRLSPENEALLDEAEATIAVLWAPNMSVGVQVVARIVEDAVRALGAAYEVEIVETHHNQKIDAPSGTATFLQQAVQRARADLSPIYGREGQVGRKPSEIGMHALRGGGVVGDHSVHLIGAYDRLEITHRAMSRELFAAGALSAARFIAGRPAGRYTLADVIS